MGGSFEIPNGLYFQRIKYNVTPCIHKNPINKTGITQSYLFDFILSLNINAIKNDRLVLNGKEIDIFIPDYNLGLEFNGVYWHSELFKDKDYHQHKTNLAKINNVDLFHIWEDDWLYKRPIVESMIKSKLGISKKIGARKCKINEVSPSDSRKFLEENHLQGSINSSIRIGLYHNDELVSLITLGKLRKTLNQLHKNNEWELYRFASKLNTNVQGGFTRLLNYFINNYNPAKIHTYASLDHSSGDVYLKHGFVLNHIAQPGYWWVVDGIKQHRYNFTKQKLIREGEDPNKTESQIMYDRGSYRVWDSGNLKFTLNLKT